MKQMYKSREKKPDSQFYKWLQKQTGKPGFTGQFARHLCGRGARYNRDDLKKVPDNEEAWITKLSKSSLMTPEQFEFYIRESFIEFRREVGFSESP